MINNANNGATSNICVANQLRTVLLHMVSGSSDGIVEAWVDGEKIYTYTGDVNHGENFADIYLQSDGAGTFFSNVIISNREIQLGEGFFKNTIEVERQLKNHVAFSVDVEREIIQPIVVPAIGEHFLHYIEEMNISQGGSYTIILPKKGEVWLHVGYASSYPLGEDFIISDGNTGSVRFNYETVHFVNADKIVISAPSSIFRLRDILISDGELDESGLIVTHYTRQNFSLDVLTTLFKSLSLDFDVEVIHFISVDFSVDVERNILANVELYATDNSEYFSGGSSAPIVIPSQSIVPPAENNTSGLQSIEISLGEQQLTDAVKVTGILPFHVLEEVSGQYFDYFFNMRVQKVRRQGILYSADCCADIDELLYTPINYDLPAITFAIVYNELKTYDRQLYPLASKHVEKIAAALGLTPVMQFQDFYSTVECNSQIENGATYSELIRDIFGWSSRVLTQVINCYIRDGKFFVIQRGHEANIIDISDSKHTLPIYDFELIRTFYQRHKKTRTETVERRLRRIPPTASSLEIDEKKPDSGYEYDDEGLLKKSETTTTNADGDSVRTVTEYQYKELENGKKVLVREVTTKFVNEIFEEKTETKHTPLKQGLSHKVKVDEDGNVIGEAIGQNTSDDRVSPYSKFREEKDDDEWEIVKDYIYIEGLSLIDTSFPIQNAIRENFVNSPYPILGLTEEERLGVRTEYGHGRLKQITEDIKNLNRKTLETVNVTLYDFPHLIDFNDRIILDGSIYFLLRNSAKTTPRIFNEQNLTLVRWY